MEAEVTARSRKGCRRVGCSESPWKRSAMKMNGSKWCWQAKMRTGRGRAQHVRAMGLS